MREFVAVRAGAANSNRFALGLFIFTRIATNGPELVYKSENRAVRNRGPHDAGTDAAMVAMMGREADAGYFARAT